MEIRNLFRGMILLFMCLFSVSVITGQNVKKEKSEYVILVSKAVRDDVAWNIVVETLKNRHDALVIDFNELPEEALTPLKKANPRYVAVVEKPENISPEYVKMMHKINRSIDGGIFGSFLWGLITGYDADSALRMVEDAGMPMIIRTALSTTPDIVYTSCFEKCAVIDQNVYNNVFTRYVEAKKKAMANADPLLVKQIEQIGKMLTDNQKSNQPVYDSLVNVLQELSDRLQIDRYLEKHRVLASWREKTAKNDTLTKHQIASDSISYAFLDLYKRLDPELLLTYSYGIDELQIINRQNHSVRAKDGKLYMDFGQEPLYFPRGKNRRVYLAMGNNGGATFGKVDNLVTAWIKDGNVSALAGYCLPEWHGQAGWGTWKFWMANPGRYTLAEAMYLNMQFILSRLNDWNPKLLEIDYPKTNNVNKDYPENLVTVSDAIGQELVTLNQMGYLYDRDVFVYYGDPKWDVRLDGTGENMHYKVTGERKGKKYVLTIQTDSQFRRQQMSGNYFRERPEIMNAATLGRLPFSYFFSEKLKEPKLAKKLKFEGTVELNENFIFIHDCFFEPNQTYKVILSVK